MGPVLKCLKKIKTNLKLSYNVFCFVFLSYSNMLESDKDLVAKTLRAVLQSNKNGVPFPRLQSEYKSLTGEYIPFKDMGFQTLEAYIKTIPTVVKIEVGRAGEVRCSVKHQP